MKKIMNILLVLVMLAMPAVASASMYYTLEGTVNQVNDNGGLARSAGISVGDTVRYVIMIDTSKSGTTTIGNGHVMNKWNTSYAGLYSGMLDGAPVDKKNYMDNYSYQTRAANDKSSVYVNAWGIDPNTFGVGSVVQQVYEDAYNMANNRKYTQLVSYNLKVVSASPTAPTPIPGAALLMLGGLGVVGFVKRKFA